MANDLTSEDSLEAGANPKKSQKLSKLPLMILVGFACLIIMIVIFGVSSNSADQNQSKSDNEFPNAQDIDYKNNSNDGADAQKIFNKLGNNQTIEGKKEQKELQEVLKSDGVVGSNGGVGESKAQLETQKKLDDLTKKYNQLVLEQQKKNIHEQKMGNQDLLEEQNAIKELKKEIASLRKNAFVQGMTGSSKTNFLIQPNSNGYDNNQSVANAQAIIHDPNASSESKRQAADFLRRNAASRLANLNNQNTGTSNKAFSANDFPHRDNGVSFNDYNNDHSGRRNNFNATLDSYNNLDRKGNWDLGNALELPQNEFIVRAGFVIPATLITGINSDLPGQVIAQVNQSVYDTATGHHLLIPQGSRLIGNYQSGVLYGQERVMIAWNRIVFPDNRTIDIGQMAGTDTSGYSGFADKVNNHWWKLISSAFLMSGITASISIATDTNDNNSSNNNSTADSVNDNMRQAMADQLGSVIAKVIERNLNVSPTIEIRPGYNFNVMVTKDITFEKDYKLFDY